MAIKLRNCTLNKGIFSCHITTRKSINTNENTERIFPSVNFRGILPTELFPRHIPRELQWEKKIKTKQKKNNDVSGFTNGMTDIIYSVGKSVGKLVCTVHHVNYKGNHRRTKSVGIFQRAPELFTFQLHY
jgi:hypothetical protein